MPRGDGTGPMGMGSMTGRKAGTCAGNSMPGYANPKGVGYGCGRGFGMGLGRGFGRGFGMGSGAGRMSRFNGRPGRARGRMF